MGCSIVEYKYQCFLVVVGWLPWRVLSLIRHVQIVIIFYCVPTQFLFLFQVSSEIPTPDTQSVRTTSGPLGPAERNINSSPYVDPRQPGIQVTWVFFIWKSLHKAL